MNLQKTFLFFFFTKVSRSCWMCMSWDLPLSIMINLLFGHVAQPLLMLKQIMVICFRFKSAVRFLLGALQSLRLIVLIPRTFGKKMFLQAEEIPTALKNGFTLSSLTIHNFQSLAAENILELTSSYNFVTAL